MTWWRGCVLWGAVGAAAVAGWAQAAPQAYWVERLAVEGASDPAYVREVVADAGLEEGKQFRVLSDDLGQVIRRLWEARLFTDVAVDVDSLDEANRRAWLRVRVREGRRLAGVRIQGLPKGWTTKINEKLNLAAGQVVTSVTEARVREVIRTYLAEKGFARPSIKIAWVPAEDDRVHLTVWVDRGPKLRVRSIVFEGNQAFPDKRLRRALRHTKVYRWWNIFRKGLFDPFEWEEDKGALAQLYFSHGYRDFRVVADSVEVRPDGYHIRVKIHEGPVFRIGEIRWIGNSKVPTEVLQQTLAIDSGAVYNKPLLEQRLFFNPMGLDVSSLYSDDGYLFFQIDYVEFFPDTDVVDIEIRIQEGPRMITNRNLVSGNLTTHDHVVLRELRTRPGRWFERSAVVRSQRELAQMGFFSPEKMNVRPHPRPEEGTVDIEYQLEEISTDKVELQGSWYQGLYLTAGVQLSNFSIQKAMQRGHWRPYPAGDAQRVALRIQTNGPRYSSVNFSFADPWFGGRKPNAFSVSTFYTRYTPNRFKISDPIDQKLVMGGLSVSLSKRLQWPDDYFVWHNTLSLTRYNAAPFYIIRGLDSAVLHNFNITHTLVRSSIDQPIYPQRGGKMELSLTYTFPYSLFREKDPGELTPAERYRWMEYYKWRFSVKWFQAVVEKLVLSPQFELGLIGAYNRANGVVPFERFVVGGSGLSGYGNLIIGKEPIALRGYQDESLTPEDTSVGIQGASSYLKYTLELRYPITLSPTMSAYVLTFFEAGNAWLDPRQISPFDIYRGAGVGIRLFMPAFGLLGLDWGYGFDRVPGRPDAHRGQFHFIIGQRF